MNKRLEILQLTGADPQFRSFLPDLARLRIEVFRGFPYLYDGSIEYEQRYLETYTRCTDSVIVLMLESDRVVGATTGLPLDAETTAFQQPFLDLKMDISRVFYCAESVILKPWRGQGIYPRFFAAREAHARKLGRFTTSCFCCVQRPSDHPLRPVAYRPLDAIWQQLGYQEQPSIRTDYIWKDIDQPKETAKPMVFWTKRL